MNEEEKKQRARENAKKYYQKNKEKILKRQKEYAKKRYREDEEFRNKIKEKNRNYVINNPEKAREIKRKSQHKYINKKRLSGELPLTQKMLIEQLQQENQQLKEKTEYLKSKIENKDRWCQLIADIGYDYDGYRDSKNLMALIDELVRYALYSRDNYDYEEFLKESDN